MHRHCTFLTGSLAILLLFASPAGAAETVPEDVTFNYSGTMLEVFDFDTGWWPSSGDIQVRFGASLDGDVESEVEAEHWVSWPEAITFNITGVGHTGWVMVDYGLDLIMQVHYDLGVLGSGTYDVPIDSWLDGITNVVAYGEFTPLVLIGSVERPVLFEQAYSEWTLLEAPIAITTGVTLNLSLVLRPTLDCEFRGERVSVFESAEITWEGTNVFVPWVEAWETDTPGRVILPLSYEAELDCSFVLELVPEVSICIGTCFDMPEVAIPIPVQNDEKLLVYDTVEVTYDFPVLQVNDRPIDFGWAYVGDLLYYDLPIFNPGQQMMEVWFDMEMEEANFDYFPHSTVLIPPGEGREVRLFFSPLTAGEKEATLLIDTDAPANNTAEILLMGTGALDSDPADPFQGPVDIADGDFVQTANCGCDLVGSATSPHSTLLALLGILLAVAMVLLGRRN